MKKLIMIVDDSASLRQVVKMTLEKMGYEVMEAKDGKEALDKAKGKKINLIITDLNMPVMDGITFIKELKKLPEHKFTPVMMLTTESQQSKMMEGKAAGAKAWLVKPFKPEQITAAIEKLILP
ncbi:MAG: response regulator [Calditerrivibrio sp.]|nr:response regulator [Calditerrivibrio sp.]